MFACGPRPLMNVRCILTDGGSLRLQYTFRSAIFFKFRFFGLSNDPNEISNVKKSIEKDSILALGPETEEHIKLAKDKIRFDL